MTVKELMTTNVIFIKKEADLNQAVRLMKQHNIGMLLVCDNLGKPEGLLTDRDILLYLSNDNGTLEEIPVSEVMSKNLITLNSEMNIHDAACLFSKHRLRRLPVVENSRLVGVLSISDLARKRIFLAEVGEIMGAVNSQR